MTRVDIAIIGSGPAGLEAALTAKNRNKSIQIFGTQDLSAKMMRIDHPITNYLGLSNVTGKQMAEAFTKQLEDADIGIVENRVTTVYAMGGFFGLQMADNTMEEASAVILCTGVTAGNPYPGETQFLGRGVSYCATCDAPLYKGKDVIVIGGSKEEESEAEFLGEVCNSVKYIPLYKGEIAFKHDNIVVVNEKPVEIKGMMKANTLVTDQNEYSTDCVFVLRAAQFPTQLVPGLQVEGNAVQVDREMKTNIPGIFAAGDIVGLPYQFIKSAGEGNIAAISAAAFVDRKLRNR